MKKQILKLRTLTKALFCITLLGVSYYSYTNGAGAPAGNTNAPGDGNCTGCHSGSLITSGANWNNMTITTNVPVNGYVPGNTYTITLTHTVTGINKWGFQLVALNGTFGQAGTLIAGTGMQALSSGGKTYLTHNSSGNTGTGTRTWTFSWTAPALGTGVVNFYAVVNAANNDGGTGGDQIYSKSITVSEFTNLPTAVIDGLPANLNVCLGDTLNLQGSGINSPTTYAWTFSGLANSSQQNPRVIFTSTGQKTITLTTSNSFGTSAVNTKFVNVIGKPSAAITSSNGTSICGSDSTTLSATSGPLFTYLWTPGNQNTASIKTITPGAYRVQVTNTSTGCSSTSTSLVLTNQTKPIPSLTLSKDTVCSKDSLSLTSNTPFSTYTFLDGNIVLSSGIATKYTGLFTPGTRSIGLLVTASSGCNSDTIRKPAFVQPLLPAPALTCGAKTSSSVAFNWSSISGASGYEVSTDTGKTWLNNSGTSFTVSGLNPNTNTQIWVRAIDASVCSRGNVGTLICSNGACSPLTYKVQFNKTVCLQSATDSGSIQVSISNLSAPNVGISYANKPYTKQLQYNARVGLGNNVLNVKIVDSLNLGCPRVDTSITLSGINPIAKAPIMGIKGALCSSDSALHTLAVFDAKGAADYFSIFKNTDTVPLKVISASNTDTLLATLLGKVTKIKNGDLLQVVALDTATGCSKSSAPYVANVFQSPKAGFTSTVNALTVTLTDTTFKTAKRDWLFFGEIPDALNATQTISKTYTTAGTKTISLSMTDSNGCMERAFAQVKTVNVGLQELTLAMPLSVYPNPVNQTVNYYLPLNDEVLISIYDVRGKLLKQDTQKENTNTIDVQGLAPGLYMLYLIQGDKNYFTKFIKE